MTQATAVQGTGAALEQAGQALAAQLQAHHRSTFPPEAQKTIRAFTPAETAKRLKITDVYLRKLAGERDGATGTRRTYTVEDIEGFRQALDDGARAGKTYYPHRELHEPLQTIAVMNFKGGSGKTTTAAHLVQHLALEGYRVLAIDLDPQASLTAMLGVQPELDVGTNQTMLGAIRYDDEVVAINKIIRATYIPSLHLVPGNLELQEFEYFTSLALASRKPGDALFFGRIAQVIAQVEDYYDVVVIDCPPTLGFLSIAALSAASGLLVTVHPQMLDVMSMSQFLALLGSTLTQVENAGANIDFSFQKFLITRFEPTDGPQVQMVDFLRSIFGERVLANCMVKSTAISDAGLTKQTLYEVTRNQFTRSTYDRAMESMNAVNGEIEETIRKVWGRA